MGKVKIKKKDTRIDMTAMSDVTVLLLTFFMLTSTFLQKEPIQPITPPSVSEEKTASENVLNILVNTDGKVFMSLIGSIEDTTYKNEAVRAELLRNAETEYNKYHASNPIHFTQREINVFSKQNAFGLPMNQMKKWLNMTDPEKRDAFIDPKKNPNCGIPINVNEDKNRLNEFQIWVMAAYNTADGFIGGPSGSIVKGNGLAIKADQQTPYSIMSMVMGNLQTINFSRFTLMTALKAEED